LAFGLLGHVPKEPKNVFKRKRENRKQIKKILKRTKK
jgi:hypothetical protein